MLNEATLRARIKLCFRMGLFLLIIGIIMLLFGNVYGVAILGGGIISFLIRKSDIKKLNELLASEPTPQTQPKLLSPVKVEKYHVAGVSFKKEEIRSLGEYNSCFDYSKKELVEENYIDEKVWELEFSPKKVELIPEPDNPHDSNAIKVIIDNVHVGYIKAADNIHVGELLSKDLITSIDADIEGGRYRYVEETEDEKYDMRTGETDNFYIELAIGIKENKPE